MLLITIDTTRSDHCSVYGYHLDTTPNLERLAEDGVRFDLAYAPTATTGPTHATIFTGLYPIAHRVVKNGRILASAHRTLAERLADRGYSTAGIAGSFVLDRKFGYAQGFDSWDDEFDRAGTTLRVERWEGHAVAGGFDRRADATTQRAVDWLERRHDPGKPFFLFVHYFDPHDPYLPPDRFAARFPGAAGSGNDLAAEVARYDAEIAFADDRIGALLDALDRLGLSEQTLVVVAGDHGEGLMQHGHMAHGVHIYEEQVRVPLLLRGPRGLPTVGVVEQAVQLVDLTPTILELTGTDIDDRDFQGRSLVPLLTGGETSGHAPPVYLHRRHYEPGIIGRVPVRGEKFAIRDGDWKYIMGTDEGTRELFDLSRDPHERRNLQDAEPERAADLARRLAAWRSTHERPDLPQGELSEEDLERLRSLGYVN